MKEEIEKEKKDKSMDEFLYFLKYYIPLHGRLRRYVLKNQLPELQEKVIPSRLFRIRQDHLDEVDDQIKKMTRVFEKVNFKFIERQDFVDFYNFLGLVLYSL